VDSALSTCKAPSIVAVCMGEGPCSVNWYLFPNKPKDCFANPYLVKKSKIVSMSSGGYRRRFAISSIVCHSPSLSTTQMLPIKPIHRVPDPNGIHRFLAEL